jgi:hypothetical protein
VEALAQLVTARFLAVVAALATISVGVLVVIEVLPRAETLTGVAIAAVGAVVLVLARIPPQDLGRYLGRLKSISLGTLGIELSDYAELAGAPAADDDDDDHATTLLGLRLLLEQKLVYLAKHVLARDAETDDSVPEFLNIGSLKHDRYLTAQQARMATDILTMREYELRQLLPAERVTFLDGANALVAGFRVEVFAAQAAKVLRAAGWDVLKPYTDKRRDLIISATGRPEQHHVVPLIATAKNSPLARGVARRMQRKPFKKAGGRCFLVVPPVSQTPEGGPLGGVEVVTLDGLLSAVGEVR